MALFLSTYTNKVDKKGRISVPATFRNAIADQSFQGIVVFRSNKYEALEGFSMDQMQELSARLDEFDSFSQEQDDLATTIFAEATPLPLDGDGRVVLPKELADYAGITENACFVGLGPKFQIWEPAKLKARRSEARGNVQSQNLTVPKGGGQK